MIESLIYMVIVLIIICVVFAVALYAVDNLTPDPIRRYLHVGVIIIWCLVILMILVNYALPLSGHSGRW